MKAIITNTKTIFKNKMITQSWLTPWGFQLKSLPNSEELEEVTKIIILAIVENID